MNDTGKISGSEVANKVKPPMATYKVVVGALVAVLAFALFYAFVLLPFFDWFFTFSGIEIDRSGPIGDSFGLLNAIVAGVALVLVAVSIKQNNHALKQNQEALDDNKEVIAMQAVELKKNNEHFAKQIEEMESQTHFFIQQQASDIFFKQLDSFSKLVDGLERDAFSGERVFGDLIRRVRQYWTADPDGSNEENRLRVRKRGASNTNNVVRTKEGLLIAYMEVYESTNDKDQGKKILAHYFRTLYRIVKSIDDMPNKALSSQQKYEYVAFARASLTQDELLMLAINGLCRFGKPKFKPLIDKYDLLNNIDKTEMWKSVQAEYPNQGKGFFSRVKNLAVQPNDDPK